MKPQYEQFTQELIAERRARLSYWRHVPTDAEAVALQCDGFTERFVERFPELVRVPGFRNGLEHWWCVEPDGTIVDPTEAQFLSCGDPDVEYSPMSAGKYPYRMGRCPEWGEYIYSDSKVEQGLGGFCSDRCRRSYARSCTRETGSCHD